MSYRTALSHVLATVVAPGAERARAEARFPRASVAALGRAGLLALTVSAELGGQGRGLEEAADVVAEVSRACPATGAVLRSHYAATVVVEAYGAPWVRRRTARGLHLGTLALGESGGPGVAPVPHSTATRTGDVVALRGTKRDVVAAGEADGYVWCSGRVDDPDGLTLWLLPADAPGLFVPARPDGRGPRGCASATVRADPVLIPACARLGTGADGYGTLLGTVLPWLAALPAPHAVRPVGAGVP